jgi:DnaJ-class molecular chaperone
MGSNEKGNHFVNVKVQIPKVLSDKEKEIFEKLKQTSLENSSS